MDKAARAEFIIEQFKLGVASNMRAHIQFTHPETLEEAVTAGLEFESIHEEVEDESKVRKPAVNALQSSASSSLPTGPECTPLSTMTDCLQSLQAGLHAIQDTLRVQTTGRAPRDYSKYRCYICNELGHIKYSCPKKDTQVSPTPQSEN